MIDLHVHTKFSDGTDDVIDILKKAEEKNIKVLSITDHDNCNFYKKIKNVNISDYYTGKLINGVELKTVINGVPIELLGYGVDTDYINNKVKEIYTCQKEKDITIMQRLYNNCIKLGVKVDKNILENYDDSYKYASTFLHKNITSYEENRKYINNKYAWEDSTSFYRKYMSNPDSDFYISNEDLLPKCEDVINLIKDAGGMVFIPHIFIYGNHSKSILNELVTSYNIDGIECYYSHFSKEDNEYLIKFCNDNNLYISGGSDYHGINKNGIKLGEGFGNLNIPENIVENWIDDLEKKSTCYA